MNKEQLNLAWETSTHYERNEFIKNWSIGSIDNSDTVGIELFKVGDEILAMDHEDINEPQPFLDLFQVGLFPMKKILNHYFSMHYRNVSTF